MLPLNMSLKSRAKWYFGVVTALAVLLLSQGLAHSETWTPVETLLQKKWDGDHPSSLKGMGLVVYDKNDKLVFEKTVGDFSRTQVVAIASASKMISGIVLFDVIAKSKGKLTLDSTTGEILGWKGDKAKISLRQLLSFTSGMKPESPSIFNARLSLEECVDKLDEIPLASEPGKRFEYGSTHLQVAARMAEVVSGKKWNALFREILADPLGLPKEVYFYTMPSQAIGSQNPFAAGGMRASMDSYTPLLALAFHSGTWKGLTIGTKELFSEQTKEPFRVEIGASPMEEMKFPYRYGLAGWIEGDKPETGSDVFSSAGAFGFTPWFDRSNGYYAILAMEMAKGARYSFPLEQELQPLIRQAMKAP